MLLRAHIFKSLVSIKIFYFNPIQARGGEGRACSAKNGLQ